MREEDKVVRYQSEIATILKEDYDYMMKYYNANHRVLYYHVMAVVCTHVDDTRGREMYEFLADITNTNIAYLYDEIYETHKEIMKKYDEWPIISEAKAFRIVSDLYTHEFQKIRDKIDTNNLTLSEKALIDGFYHTLMSPLRNPNIKVHEGFNRCYYDRIDDKTLFMNDLKNGIEYIKNNVYQIELLNTPDEIEEDKSQSDIELD